ncbi:MAG: OmpA family protein [Stagnimonas sp.]|nr:OmpA family protein [Stagnimonas sp.]
MRTRTLNAALLAGLLAPLWMATAQATDIPTKDAKGLKDPPGLSRFTGSALFLNEFVDYDELKVPATTVESTERKMSAAKYAEASGQRWRMMYAIPDGRSPIEVVRNYQQQLKAKGYTALHECTADTCGGDTQDYDGGTTADTFINFLYPRSEFRGWDDSAAARCAGGSFITDMRYAVLKNEATGELVALVTHRPGIVSAHCPEEEWKKHLFATVVYVKPKTMETNMKLEASALEKAMGETGKVAIYGILFDTASATIKPESKPSLDEIGKLLKKEAKLGLHIVGHTDGEGTLAGNFDLSKRRAEAVRAALIKDYGIAANRLTGNGVASLAPVAPNTSDEGRAKNRRVELVPY